jgi:hypothetical protein
VETHFVPVHRISSLRKSKSSRFQDHGLDSFSRLIPFVRAFGSARIGKSRISRTNSSTSRTIFHLLTKKEETKKDIELSIIILSLSVT